MGFGVFFYCCDVVRISFDSIVGEYMTHEFHLLESKL